MNVLKRCAAYVAAVLATVALGTSVQTQINLADLAGLGVPVPLGTRLEVTAHDFAGFAPLFAVLVAIGLLIAFTVTGLIRLRVTKGRSALYALAGAVAMAAILLGMEAAFGIPVVAAARGAGGFVLLMATGAIGGWVFARLSQ